jgi:hypothetical protein
VLEFKKIAREDLEIGSAIYMNGGIVNMALSNFKGKGSTAASDLKEGSTFVGAHHFGIQVDDLIETQSASSGRRQVILRPRRRTRRQLRAQVQGSGRRDLRYLEARLAGNGWLFKEVAFVICRA